MKCRISFNANEERQQQTLSFAPHFEVYSDFKRPDKTDNYIFAIFKGELFRSTKSLLKDSLTHLLRKLKFQSFLNNTAYRKFVGAWMNWSWALSIRWIFVLKAHFSNGFFLQTCPFNHSWHLSSRFLDYLLLIFPKTDSTPSLDLCIFSR